jgi:hypothetical protein
MRVDLQRLGSHQERGCPGSQASVESPDELAGPDSSLVGQLQSSVVAIDEGSTALLLEGLVDRSICTGTGTVTMPH